MATQWTAGLSDGQILTAGKLNEIGASGNVYTPQWTASTTNPVLNNGTISGTWVRINKWIFGQIFIVVGSATNVGVGFYRFSVPVAIAGNNTLCADLHLLDGSAGYVAYNGFGIPVVAGGTTMEFRTHGAGTFTNAVPLPGGLGNTDQIRIRFFYEAA
jgi:hypothetical protein